MGLENVFGKPEKPEEEKKLQVIVSEEAILDDLFRFFEKSHDGVEGFNACKSYLNTIPNLLQSYKISPKLIRKFYEKARMKQDELTYLSLDLSAMMHASYQQGYNNFGFGEVDVGGFGILLQGTKSNPIKINISTMRGTNNFIYAQYFSAKIKKLDGDYHFDQAHNFSVAITHLKGSCNFQLSNEFSAKIKKLEGNHNFNYANNGVIKITTLEGNSNFGYAKNGSIEITNHHGQEFGWRQIKNCKVYSQKQEILESVREQVVFGEDNSFHIGRLRNKKWD
ncbi:hypothetical protein HY643_04665 [Candidatus Woesearchaeota archaeon]|nr:hypothetical protein [Candidatus Woesearchaeota archaeon]